MNNAHMSDSVLQNLGMQVTECEYSHSLFDERTADFCMIGLGLQLYKSLLTQSPLRDRLTSNLQMTRLRSISRASRAAARLVDMSSHRNILANLLPQFHKLDFGGSEFTLGTLSPTCRSAIKLASLNARANVHERSS